MVDREYLIKEIKSLSDSIRKKHKQLKLGVNERDRFLETTFKPVVAPLKDISNILKHQTSTDSKQDVIRDEKTEEEDFESEEDTKENDVASEEETLDSLEGEVENSGNMEKHQEPQDAGVSHRLSILGQDIASKGPLTRKYLIKMLHATPGNRRYHVYGARLENDGLKIGDSLLVTDDDDNLVIKGKTYKGTPGLFELVFKSSPVKYTMRDLNTFKSILKLTNAHKKEYIVGSSIYRNRSKKYVDVISKLFPPQRGFTSTGKGISMKSTYDTNVIYYSNINKLADRMRLLYEAKQSGHTGVDNELIAITEEMRNKQYIL